MTEVVCDIPGILDGGSGSGRVRASREGVWRAALVAGVVVASMAVRAPRLVESLWYDEWCRTSAMLNRGTVVERLFHDVHNPLYNAVMYLWISVFGDSCVSVRLPSVIAGYVAVWLVWGVVKRWVGSAVAWAVGAWLLFAPMMVWYSTEAKNNMFLVAVAMWAVWANERMVRGPTRARVMGAIVAGAAAVYTDFAACLVLGPLALWIVAEAWRGKDRALLRAVGMSAAGVIGCSLPLVVFKAGHTDELWRDYLRSFRVRELVELVGGDFLTGGAFAPDQPARWWASVAGAVVAAPLMVMGAVWLKRTVGGRGFVWQVAGGIGMLVLVSIAVDGMFVGRVNHVYQARNLLVVLPAFGVMLVAGAWSVRSAVVRRGLVGMLVGVNVVAAVVMVTVHRDRWTVEKPRPDWRGVAGVIRADAGRDAVVVVSRSPVMPIGVYASGVEVRTTWGAELALADVVREAGAVYYVSDAMWWPEEPARLDAWRRELGLVEVAQRGAVVVYRVGAGGTAGSGAAGGSR